MIPIPTYKELHKFLKVMVKRDFGRRCDDFNIGCVVCQQYLRNNEVEYGIDFELK